MEYSESDETQIAFEYVKLFQGSTDRISTNKATALTDALLKIAKDHYFRAVRFLDSANSETEHSHPEYENVILLRTMIRNWLEGILNLATEEHLSILHHVLVETLYLVLQYEIDALEKLDIIENYFIIEALFEDDDNDNDGFSSMVPAMDYNFNYIDFESVIKNTIPNVFARLQ